MRILYNLCVHVCVYKYVVLWNHSCAIKIFYENFLAQKIQFSGVCGFFFSSFAYLRLTFYTGFRDIVVCLFQCFNNSIYWYTLPTLQYKCTSTTFHFFATAFACCCIRIVLKSELFASWLKQNIIKILLNVLLGVALC